MKKKHDIVILRVDPIRKTVASMKIRIGSNATNQVRRLCNANKVGWRELLPVDGVVLTVAGALEVDESMKGWRLRGGEDTAGIGVLFGHGPNHGMVDCPVTAEWIRSRISWLDGEDVAGRTERARELLASLNPGIRTALLAAVPAPDGDMWVPVDHQAEFDAMITLGLSTLGSRGQKLTSLGIAVCDLLDGAA
jgi:hypothetical protein